MWWWWRCLRSIFLNIYKSSHISWSIFQSIAEILDVFHTTPDVREQFQKKNGFCCNLVHHEPKITNWFHCFSVFRWNKLARFWYVMVKITTKSILLTEVLYYTWIGMKNIFNFCKRLKNGSTGMAAYVSIKKNTPPASPSSSHSSDEVLNLKNMKDSPA